MRRRMVEHSALDIMCPNRFCCRPERSTRMCTRIRQSLCVDYPQRNAQVLSAQYGANVLLLGAALMLATTHHSAVREWHVLALLCGVMMLQLLWMMWYVLVRDRHGSAHADKDKHATTCWVRGGLTLLALLSLVMDVFRIGLYVGFSACVSAVLGAYPVIHAAHTIAQVHFLWFHIKDVIKSFQTFERFGVIHAVVTNLLLWGSGVMSEAEHFLNNHNKRVSAPSFHGNHSTDPPCNCSTSTCSVFSSSLFYLYPFNIEFHIFVSAMLFVMWKNIGRSVETVSAPMPPQGRGLGRGLSVGPVLGCGALACTVGVLVVYLTHVEQADTRQAAVSMFYVYGVVMSLSMCGAASAGLLLYRAQQRPLDTSTNPARELDTELLVWSAAGAWLMAWCSVIAVTSGSSAAPHRWISGVYATLLVLETSVQNLFIMESLYRPQECESAPPSEVFSVTCALAPPYGSLRGGIINRAYETQERPLEEPEDNASVYRRKPSQVPLSADLTPPPRLKRNVLKNIALFLTLANVCLWILPAFGVRPQYDSGLEEDSFGFSVWVSVLNFAVPLNLFYRMHAVASLFEVFRRI